MSNPFKTALENKLKRMKEESKVDAAKTLVCTGALYKHYKGGIYSALFVLPSSTNATQGELMVVYYSDAPHGMHVRTVKEFNEVVEWPDGEKRPRFVPCTASGEI